MGNDPIQEGNVAMAFGSKQISNLKAELVRNNLVSRSDLMKLYKPLQAKEQQRENNPWFNKSMVPQASQPTNMNTEYGQ